VERALGAPVASAVSQPGGFSPGAAARLITTDGRRAFVKAISSDPNPDSPRLHRQEARVTAQLPPGAPVPRLLWSYDDGEWVLLLLEDIEGWHPAMPWRSDELARVLAALADLSVALTPAPFAAPSIRESLDAMFTGWRSFVSAGAKPDDAWAARHVAELASVESSWADGAAGSTLLHTDLRADNLLLTHDRVVVVDWPGACVGAAWIDLLAMLPSVAMQGGPAPWTVFDAHVVSRDADAGAVTAVLAGLAGYFAWGATQPPPAGLPTLRVFQAAQAVEALRWLEQRTGWA
jgi:aminoglycoside phosphotransferase (APT) family kinase protein